MRKHFIWLLFLGGCGAGGAQIVGGDQVVGEGVGVSGNGHPELAGVWVQPWDCAWGVNAVVVKTCWGELWKFDERGRLTAQASGGTENLSELLVNPRGRFIRDYAANESWINPGSAWYDDGTLACLGIRIVTESSGQNIRIRRFVRASGCEGEGLEFTLSDDGNSLVGEDIILTRPEALGTRIVSFPWEHPADWKEVHCHPDGSFAGEIVCPTID